MKHRTWLSSLVLTAVVGVSTPATAGPVSVTYLVTDDQSVQPAKLTDTSLKNAWGVSYPPGGPFWVSDAGTGVSTLYRVDPVTNQPTKLGLTVTIPGIAPTGQVFSGTSQFNGDAFIFANVDGSISGWRGALGTTAEVLVPANPASSYTGLAQAVINGNTYLYGADFHGAQVDVFKGSAAAPDLTGTFFDPNLPAGYAPFNVQNLDDQLFVAYALQDANQEEEVAGLGFGFVDVFDLQGNLLDRVGTQGLLNAPWGMAIAPSTFGDIAGDLFVGNFGDGRINIFDLDTNMFVGQLRDILGNTVAIDGLWALIAGNDGLAGSSGKIYFSAGPNDETNGAFGVLEPVPEPATLTLLASVLGGMGLCGRLRRRR